MAALRCASAFIAISITLSSRCRASLSTRPPATLRARWVVWCDRASPVALKPRFGGRFNALPGVRPIQCALRVRARVQTMRISLRAMDVVCCPKHPAKKAIVCSTRRCSLERQKRRIWRSFDHCSNVVADVFTKSKRSEVMSRIRARDTLPERAVRSMIHRMGYRFRLHRVDLPGKLTLCCLASGQSYSCMGVSGTDTRDADLPIHRRADGNSGSGSSNRMQYATAA